VKSEQKILDVNYSRIEVLEASTNNRWHDHRGIPPAVRKWGSLELVEIRGNRRKIDVFYYFFFAFPKWYSVRSSKPKGIRQKDRLENSPGYGNPMKLRIICRISK